MSWEKTVAVEELQKKPALYKSGKRQIALFGANGCAYAVDNRCPHEGYPLVQGSVDDECVLTCNWHNWKFRLKDGECVLGGDHVRSYPAKIEYGFVWVDTTDVPREKIQEEILRGLRTAFDKREFDRLCREIARLHFNRLDPAMAVWKAIEWSHDRWEFGTTHAFAATADWLLQADSYTSDEDFEKRLICLAEAVDHIAFDALRQPKFPYAGEGEAFSEDAFCEAVEREQYARVEGMVTTGLRDGLHWPDMEQAFCRAALEHYNDFGHSAIYVYKTSQLIQAGGENVERHLLLPLARSLCYATREDQIPEFKSYGKAMKQMARSFETDESIVEENLFGMNTEQACEWVAANFSKYPARTLFDALLRALAKSTLHFDLKFDRSFNGPVSQNVGWLDFTHGVTFANAVRNMCAKYPNLWGRGLLQMACFLGRNRPFVDLDLDESPWFVEDQTSFWHEVESICLDHGMRLPIFSAHVIKTARATEEELEHASPLCQRYLLAALNRFLHSPIKQKHVRRLASQAIVLVKRDFV